MDTCSEDFVRLAREVGGIDCTKVGFVSFHNPLALDSGTMPIIELVLVVGTVASLVHAVRRFRGGDPTNLTVFGAAILAPLLIEPIAYFPQWFGLEEKVGITFVHNEFTVQFLFGRLPIYVFGMYAAFACPLYLLVQRAGIVRRCHPLVAASTVSFLFVVLYELIDQIGPQLHWWVWNPEHDQITARLGVTPMTSLTGFSAAFPFAITFWTIVVSRRRSGVALNAVIVSVLFWPFILISGLPRQLVGALGLSPDAAQYAGSSFVLTILGLTTVYAFVTAARFADDPIDVAEAIPAHDRFTVWSMAVYAVTGLGIWLFALPEHLDAVDGRTADGGEVGSLAVALVTLAIGTAFIATGERVAARRAASAQPHTRSGHAPVAT